MDTTRQSSGSQQKIPYRNWINLAILCFINIISYSDRLVLSVLISEIKEDFDIDNDLVGLLHSSFFILFVIGVPVYGYLGDRYNRKYLLSFSIFLWNITNLGSSFLTTYWPFLCLRTVFGLGHAGFTALAPVILGDLFRGGERTKILTIFYLGIPAGLGLGYIVGKHVEMICGSWRWSLRVTPIASVLYMIVWLVAMKEPRRGEIEGKAFSAALLIDDIQYLSKNVSFILSTVSFACVAFTAEACSWWGPHLFNIGVPLLSEGTDLVFIDSIFGGIAILSGVIGVVLGFIFSTKLKAKCPKIDPIICATGLFIGMPILIGASFLIPHNLTICFILLFIGLITMNLNWALMVDIVLCVVLPTKRSLAMGLQLFVGHGFGSLLSPYLVGLFSDYLATLELSSTQQWNEFRALQYAFFGATAIAFVGSCLLMACACFIVRDIKKVDTARDKHGNTDEELP
jgi:MFS family permease